MKIDLNKPLLNIKNEPMNGQTIGRLLCEFLGGNCKGIKPIRCIQLAMKLYNDEPIELDAEEIEILKKEVENSNFINLIKARIIEEFIQQQA